MRQPCVHLLRHGSIVLGRWRCMPGEARQQRCHGAVVDGDALLQLNASSCLTCGGYLCIGLGMLALKRQRGAIEHQDGCLVEVLAYGAREAVGGHLDAIEERPAYLGEGGSIGQLLVDVLVAILQCAYIASRRQCSATHSRTGTEGEEHLQGSMKGAEWHGSRRQHTDKQPHHFVDHRDGVAVAKDRVVEAVPQTLIVTGGVGARALVRLQLFNTSHGVNRDLHVRNASAVR